MKSRDVIRALKADGWKEARSKGSHLHMRHASKPGTVTVPIHGAKDLKLPTLASIERQSGLKLRSK
jgi:predicted RNA binding protein YcfA (HicA-like mRNA interferase family)